MYFGRYFRDSDHCASACRKVTAAAAAIIAFTRSPGDYSPRIPVSARRQKMSGYTLSRRLFVKIYHAV